MRGPTRARGSHTTRGPAHPELTIEFVRQSASTLDAVRGPSHAVPCSPPQPISPAHQPISPSLHSPQPSGHRGPRRSRQPKQPAQREHSPCPSPVRNSVSLASELHSTSHANQLLHRSTTPVTSARSRDGLAARCSTPRTVAYCSRGSFDSAFTTARTLVPPETDRQRPTPEEPSIACAEPRILGRPIPCKYSAARRSLRARHALCLRSNAVWRRGEATEDRNE